MSEIDVPVVVAGELITAAWGNQIRQDLIDLEDTRKDLGPHHLRLVPGGNTDAGAGGYNDWLTLGNVTVPTTAEAAIIGVSLNRIFATTTGQPDYLARVRIGAVADANPPGTILLPSNADTVPVTSWSFNAYIQTPPTGLQAVVIQVNRVGGTGVLRATTATVVTASVEFRG